MNTRHRIRRALIAAWFVILAAFAALLVTPWSVHAASEVPPPPAADAGTTADAWAFNLNAPTVLWVTAVLIPLIGGLLMRLGVKGNHAIAVNLLLNGVNAVLVAATTENGDAILSQSLVTNFLMSFVISIATLYGFYKKLQVPAADDALGAGATMSLDTKLKSIGGIVGPKAA